MKSRLLQAVVDIAATLDVDVFEAASDLVGRRLYDLNDLNRAELFRLYKNVCELKKFVAWREKEQARRTAFDQATGS